MYVKKRRGLVALAAITASVALSGLGAGGAQATLLSPCNGDTIAGQGSSLQGAAQTAWTAGFKTNMNGGCTVGVGTNPTVSYTATSSGRCLNTWKADNTTPVNTAVAFCGTDDAPNDTQITNINAATGASVLSIPVAQAAIAFVVNPPANCTITTATQTQLERVFRVSNSTWTDLGATGAGCDTAITPVVRADSSGTSYQLKHWFTGITTTAPVTGGTELWGGSTGGATSFQDTNTAWPSASVVASRTGCLMTCSGAAGSGSGGGDEVKTVGVTSNSIGYAALADARSVYGTTTYPNLKWIKVSNVDPSSNGLNESTKGTSNCTQGTNAYKAGGTAGSLPVSTTVTWADVYLVNAGVNYPLCTLTWDTALTSYSAHWGATTGPAIATSVHDYLHYVVGTLGGQADGLGAESDYQKIPEDVQTKATTGVQLITG